MRDLDLVYLFFLQQLLFADENILQEVLVDDCLIREVVLD